MNCKILAVAVLAMCALPVAAEASAPPVAKTTTHSIASLGLIMKQQPYHLVGGTAKTQCDDVDLTSYPVKVVCMSPINLAGGKCFTSFDMKDSTGTGSGEVACGRITGKRQWTWHVYYAFSSVTKKFNWHGSQSTGTPS